MTTDLAALYEKYVTYVKRLQEDFSLHVGPDVVPRYRPQLLSIDDFLRVWHAWGNSSGVQEMWRQRFERGYDAVGREFSERLRAALCRADSSTASDKSKDRAA
jgi:hypothetical protein